MPPPVSPAPGAPSRKPPLAIVVAGLLAWVAPGCVPCEVDGDCGEGSYCSEQGTCAQDCLISGDCAGNDQGCDPDGRCVQTFAPAVTWLSPAADSAVGEVFSIEAEVRFVGESVDVELARGSYGLGEACAAFQPQRVTLLGDPLRESVQTVAFPDVVSLGRDFELQVLATYPHLEGSTRSASVFLQGDVPDGLVMGAQVIAPGEGLIAIDPPISVPVEIRLPDAVNRAWGWIEPAQGPATPRRSLASLTDVITDLRLPVARGPQMLQIEVEQNGALKRCTIGLSTSPATFSGLEIALFFQGPSAADLDLWLYAEPDDGPPDVCNARSPSSTCLDPAGTLGLREWGEEALQLAVRDGVYGIAVAPGAVGEPPSATVRVSRGDTLLGWLGPRTVLVSEGEVWLAGRLYVVSGQVTVEPLSGTWDGLPDVGPGSW